MVPWGLNILNSVEQDFLISHDLHGTVWTRFMDTLFTYLVIICFPIVYLFMHYLLFLYFFPHFMVFIAVFYLASGCSNVTQ